MRSSVLLLPLLVIAFQSHQPAGRDEPSLRPVTAAGWRGMLPVSGLDPQAADDLARPGCTQRAGRPDARSTPPSADPRPATPGARSALSPVAATAGDSTRIGRGVSS